MHEKLAVIDLSETEKQIGEKLFAVLSSKQKEELIKYILKIRSEGAEMVSRTCDNVLKNPEQEFTEIQKQDLYICIEKRVVRVRGRDVHLTVKEFDLLALLFMHPKRVFTYGMIMALIWNEDYTFYFRKAANNHVSNLRKKIKIVLDIPNYIKSVYGVGYKFEV